MAKTLTVLTTLVVVVAAMLPAAYAFVQLA